MMPFQVVKSKKKKEKEKYSLSFSICDIWKMVLLGLVIGKYSIFDSKRSEIPN